ncbi:MAG: IMS domain-containing protein [Leptolyngbyaceae cyanobacterium]
MVWTRDHLLQNGKYKIERVLGTGGFGITYLAHCKEWGQVVIKTLNDDVQMRSDFDEIQDEFLNEALRIRGCQHPHIVKVHKLFQEKVSPPYSDTTPGQSFRLVCIVMEFIQGLDLARMLAQQGPLSEKDAVRYIRQIGDALTVVHGNGLLHRDVKPNNIMVRQDTDEAVLIDFGIAREFAPNQTRTHTRAVTPGYAPIEQYERQAKRGSFTDVYALAATLYSIVTGDAPPEAQSRELHWLKYKRDLLSPPNTIQDTLSDRTNTAIIKGMEMKAEYRPNSMVKWLDLLPEQSDSIPELGEGQEESPSSAAVAPDEITAVPYPPPPPLVTIAPEPDPEASSTTLTPPAITPALHHQPGWSSSNHSPQPDAAPPEPVEMDEAPIPPASPLSASPSSESTHRPWMLLMLGTVGVIAVGIAIGMVIFHLQDLGPDNPGQQTIIPPPPPPDPIPILTPEAAEAIIRSWFDAKQAAMGPEYDISRLANVLTGEPLTFWQEEVNQAQANDFYLIYDYPDLTIDAMPTQPTNPVTISVSVTEIGNFYESGQLRQNESYRSPLNVRYELIFSGDDWKIQSIDSVPLESETQP